MNYMNNMQDYLNLILNSNFLIAPFIALISGFLTSLLPCSLSTYPLIIGYVNNNQKHNTLFLSLLFSLGNVLTFTIIGVIVSLFSNFISLTNGFWYLIVAFILLIMALETFGITHFLPKYDVYRNNERKGYLGSFIMGVLGGLASSPCSTPVLITILSLISLKKDIIFGITLLLFYSIGHSILIIITGLTISSIKKITSNKKYGYISQIISYILGIIILISALYFFYLGI